jgi:hypothetical protein
MAQLAHNSKHFLSAGCFSLQALSASSPSGTLAPMLTFTTEQMRRAVQNLPNVCDFCRRYKLPRRSLMRFRTGDNIPRDQQAEKIRAALEREIKRTGADPVKVMRPRGTWPEVSA